MIGARDIKGTDAAVPDVGTGRGEEPVGGLDALQRGEGRGLGRGVGLGAGDAIGIDDKFAMLALAEIAAEFRSLAEGEPKRAGKPLHDRGGPQHHDVDPLVGNAVVAKGAGDAAGGFYATARGMVAFYQAMLNGGELAGKRFVGPRVLDYAIRNWTGDMVDENMGMPMHRGIGPHLRGTTATIRGLGSFASPRTFGHGGAGNSYCWADPDSGVSFAYLTNCRIPDPWHSVRLDLVSNFVHSAIL